MSSKTWNNYDGSTFEATNDGDTYTLTVTDKNGKAATITVAPENIAEIAYPAGAFDNLYFQLNLPDEVAMAIGAVDGTLDTIWAKLPKRFEKITELGHAYKPKAGGLIVTDYADYENTFAVVSADGDEATVTYDTAVLLEIAKFMGAFDGYVDSIDTTDEVKAAVYSALNTI